MRVSSGDSLMQNDLFQQVDGGAIPTSPLQCHQYKMRKFCEETEHKENLFGAYWNDVDKSLKNSIVKPVSFETAKVIVEKYEWLKCMPSIVTHQFGIFFSGCCGGV